MNKQIKKLIKQATKVVEPNDPDYRHEFFDKEKFARLVVIECKQILLGLMLEGTSDNGALDLSLTLINDHFGMEDDELTNSITC